MFNNPAKENKNFLLNERNSEIVLENTFDIHNSEIIDDFKNFLKSENDYFLLQGFMGEGKSLLLKRFEENIPYSSILLKINCNTFSNIDDILLSLNVQLKEKSQKFSNRHLNIQSKDFRERVKLLLKSINTNIIVFIDGFELLKSNKNQDSILNFLQHMTNIPYIKTVISGRVIGITFFQDKKFQKSVMKPFSLDELKSYMKENNNSDSSSVEDLYRITDGHYLYITLCCKIMNIFNINAEKLTEEFSKKRHNIDDFLLLKLLGLATQNYNEVLWYLCLCQCFANEKMLKNLNLIKRDELNYLQKNNILYENGKIFYLKDYFKKLIEPQINNYIKLKIYKKFKEYYSAQIELKVADRDLNISRETLRNLVQYYTSSNVDTPEIINLPSEKTPPQVVHPPQPIFKKENKPLPPKKIKKSETKKETIIKTKNYEDISLSEEEVVILQNNEPETKKYRLQNKTSDFHNVVEYTEETTDKTEINSFLKMAEKKEQSFDYEEALYYYKQACDKAEEHEKQYILSKMASNYKKTGQVEKATDIYKNISDYYQKNGLTTKYAYMLYNLASTYKEQYQYEESEKYYNLINSMEKQLPDNLLTKVNLDLAEIFDYKNLTEKNSIFYQKALNYAQKTNNNVLVAETYFKYALSLDDDGKYEDAIKYYLISTISCYDSQQNQYLSLAFSNIGSIYEEQNNLQEAIKYYLKALSVDEKNANYEGQFFLYAKLGNLYREKHPEKVMTLFHKALFAAQQLKDNFYICSALLNIGDYYYQEGNDEQALRYYLNTNKYAINLKSTENIEIIKSRIKDIKIKLGNTKFKECIERLKKHAKKK